MTYATRFSGISRILILVVAMLWVSSAAAGQWASLGPDGGDVRSLSYDPRNPDHIFLGTSTGTLFHSTDGGRSWVRYTHLGDGDDFVVDHLALDPQNPDTIYAAVWSVDNQQAGDLYVSHDGGQSWKTTPGMHGKSIRAFSVSASDSKVLVAGALDGVFRSKDSGDTWDRISASTPEIKNIESLAVDPKNPDVVYAGTWHLAWKTSDGGATWHHINKGMIDDSDVFSVIVDAKNPSVVFASACSGIYKSDSGGESFQKIQGIPFTARRTRVLKQDPSNESTVYAGTTEGLWKTTDLGKSWKRMSDPQIVVNDVEIDPRNSKRVLLATDRGGVLASDDGAQTFSTSNHGYTHRYVTAFMADKNDPDAVLVGVVNDKEMGGVFSTRDAGQHWTQKSSGLGGRDVFSLKQTADGTLVAGTNRGVFILAHNSNQWKPMNAIVNETVSTRMAKKGTKKVAVTSKTAIRSVLDARVNDVELTSKGWLAATSSGLYMSANDGKSWTGGPVMGKSDFIWVQGNDETLVAATRSAVLVSKNRGSSWEVATIPAYIASIHDVLVTPTGQILLASREGAFLSGDTGATWQHVVNGLPDKNISSTSYDAVGNQLLATSSVTGVIFESQDGGQSWHRGPDTGYPLRSIGTVHGKFMAATPFDGVIVQPDGSSQSAAAATSN